MRHSNPRVVRSPALAKSSTSGDDVKTARSTVNEVGETTVEIGLPQT